MTDPTPQRICLQCGADASDHEGATCVACGGPVTSVRSRRSDLIGTTVGGRYVLLDTLGEGGFGSVYRARHATVDQIVAVKILRADVQQHPNMLQRFYAEARTTAKLKHPNNVRLFDFGQTEDGLVYIAMELVDGVSLDEVQPMPPQRAVRILDQIAAALNEAHELGIVHRDLKPANLMVSRVDGEDFVRVLDYGIAKLDDGSKGLTQTGGFIGTPAYASPEQVVGRPLDRRSDIYAFGVIAWELLAGRRPFTHADALSLAVAHRDEAPPELSRFASVSPDLARLVMRCLAKSPDDRPDSMQDVRDVLQRSDERIQAVPLASGPAPPAAARTHLDAADPATRVTANTPVGGETAWAETIESQPSVGGTRMAVLPADGPTTPSASAADAPPAPRPVSMAVWIGLALVGLTIGAALVLLLGRTSTDTSAAPDPTTSDTAPDTSPDPAVAADDGEPAAADTAAAPTVDAGPPPEAISAASTTAVTVAATIPRHARTAAEAIAADREAADRAAAAELRPTSSNADTRPPEPTTPVPAADPPVDEPPPAEPPPTEDIDDAEALRQLLRNR